MAKEKKKTDLGCDYCGKPSVGHMRRGCVLVHFCDAHLWHGVRRAVDLSQQHEASRKGKRND